MGGHLQRIIWRIIDASIIVRHTHSILLGESNYLSAGASNQVNFNGFIYRSAFVMPKVDNEDAASLQRRRKMIIAACTRICTFTEAIASVTPSIAAQLGERCAKLDRYWTDYDSVQTNLELIDESEEAHRAPFEDFHYALCAQIRELLYPATAQRVAASPSRWSSSVVSRESFGHIRLPKLELPKFSGKYDEWCPFFDSFNSLIHENASLSPVQRLQYLRASLTGDAFKVISALEISDTNYQVAWDLLKERYDNKRAIVQSHIQAILDLPTMAKENVAELRQITDGATRHIHALQALKRPTAQWDDLLVYILSNKLDALTSREWQLSLGEHLIYHCEKLIALPVPQRIAEIKKRKICINCLRSVDHTSNKCPSGNCKICKAKHNTLLHLAAATSVKSDISESGDRGSVDAPALATSPAPVVMSGLATPDRSDVMLSTVLAYVYDANGCRRACRVLLDSGSQINFISRHLADALDIKTRSSDISISGINNVTTRAFQAAEIRLHSRTSSFSILVDCIVTEHVTGKLPAFTLKRNAFEIPANLELADPQFHVSSEIDVLIGAEHFWSLLCIGQIKATPSHPTLQKTRFGWILAGRLHTAPKAASHVHSLHASISNKQLHEQLSRFWDVENISAVSNHYTSEEAHCERHFLENMTRTDQGKFIVKLPFKESEPDAFVNSREIALKRLGGIERRLSRDSELKTRYSQFINEYNTLGHMKLISDPPEDPKSFYLPHHCIVKAPAANKFRVVFDASAKDAAGISLNDTLMVGPTVQQDLFTILLRFRTHRFAFSADIVKMYRQILVHPSQTRYQRILWRDDFTSTVATYELSTVTYGTSSASFLATRCLTWLSEHYAGDWPNGSKCVERDFYVDDMLTGADTIDEALIIRDEAIKVLRCGGFELGK
ncbi:PREDICTED: uncharacterized protein LOC108775780 [Cyphomyrmex costatus]|uniref:uncharacterized protein LOC108775780 n=1 Tax=Cyphomyrmex costatus TaxID=456900 RepID=UPI0008522869|nr:PREDICTED: uncharacterized protein LOC108775780 [Cyphomyrmex costatus]